jgi:hypothetical protein
MHFISNAICIKRGCRRAGPNGDEFGRPVPGTGKLKELLLTVEMAFLIQFKNDWG